MNLIPVGIPVAIAEPATVLVAEDESRLAEQLRLAEKIHARTIQTISHITTRVRAMFDALNEYSKDIQVDIATILSELHMLQAEARRVVEAEGRKNRQPDDLDKEFQQHQFEYGSYTDQEDEVDTVTEPRDEKPELVMLYRKIANKTHPDKTDDPALHLLFLTAKEYRKKGDLKGLQEIWDFLTGVVTQLTSKLRQRLEELVREIAMLENQLEYLRQSQDYTLLHLFDRDKEAVCRMSRQQLGDKRDRLRAHLELLRRTLGKEPPPKPSYLQIERG